MGFALVSSLTLAARRCLPTAFTNDSTVLEMFSTALLGKVSLAGPVRRGGWRHSGSRVFLGLGSECVDCWGSPVDETPAGLRLAAPWCCWPGAGPLARSPEPEWGWSSGKRSAWALLSPWGVALCPVVAAEGEVGWVSGSAQWKGLCPLEQETPARTPPSRSGALLLSCGDCVRWWWSSRVGSYVTLSEAEFIRRGRCDLCAI